MPASPLRATALVLPLLAALAPPGGARAEVGPGLGAAITFAGDAAFPPYEYLDERGEPAGLNVDLIRAVARERGWRLTVRLSPWTEVRDGLRRGEVDVATMYRSPERAREVDFAIAHELVSHELYVRRGAPAVHALADLRGRRVLVEAETYAADVLPSLVEGTEVVAMPSEPAALQALAEGRGDVALVSQAAGRPFQSRQALGDRIAPSGPPVLLAEYAFVAPKGRPQLVAALNEGVAAIRASGEYERLFQRWLRPDRSAEWARQARWALGAALLAVLLVAAWNWSLRRRVAAQTEALRREDEARRGAQAALAESERARRQAQKMEAIGRLAGGIAHDFNNLLTVIVNYAEFARDRLRACGEDPGEVDEILAAAERASGLTRQVLAFSRAGPLESRPVDLAALVGGGERMLQRLVGGHIALRTELPAGPVVVEADPTQLEQIVLNLAANARDAMPDGGPLTIAVAARPASDGPGLAVLTVTDAGVGMTEATRARLFEPFFTTKAPGRGTGLGLATVLSNAQRLGGRVEVQSAPGQGTTFTVLLPRCPPERAPAAAAAPASPRAARPQDILLVEDDPALRRASRLALERAGHRVIEAGDGAEAAEVAGRTPPGLVVTDVMLPRRSGPQLVEGLRARWPGLRVLYVTGYVEDGARLGLEVPGTEVLRKPCSPAALVEAVARLAEARG